MSVYNKSWWKVLTVILLFYTVIAGFLFKVPRLPVLNETIRNQYFHVPMWFGMILLLIVSIVYAIKYLRNGKESDDIYSASFASVAVVFGLMGIISGSIWTRYTWGISDGKWWVNDPKLNGAAISMLIYLAYLVLRNSFEDLEQRARISAVYNIFAFAIIIPLLFVLPRLTDSLHPGNGGNPGFNAYDMDNNLRMVFYPAVLGWMLLGTWIASLYARFLKVKSVNE
jgi:heme exporter protein C